MNCEDEQRGEQRGEQHGGQRGEQRGEPRGDSRVTTGAVCELSVITGAPRAGYRLNEVVCISAAAAARNCACRASPQACAARPKATTVCSRCARCIRVRWRGSPIVDCLLLDVDEQDTK